MRPAMSVMDCERKSLKTKFKDKRLCRRACDRDVIRKGAELNVRGAGDLFASVIEA